MAELDLIIQIGSVVAVVATGVGSIWKISTKLACISTLEAKVDALEEKVDDSIKRSDDIHSQLDSKIDDIKDYLLNRKD